MTAEELREQFKQETGNDCKAGTYWSYRYVQWLESKLTRPLPNKEEMIERSKNVLCKKIDELYSIAGFSKISALVLIKETSEEGMFLQAMRDLIADFALSEIKKREEI